MSDNHEIFRYRALQDKDAQTTHESLLVLFRISLVKSINVVLAANLGYWSCSRSPCVRKSYMEGPLSI